MKRTRTEHTLAGEGLTTTTKRIVRRKVTNTTASTSTTSGGDRRRSPSPTQELAIQSSRREVRTTASNPSVKYVKYSTSSKYHSKYGTDVENKFDHFEPRSGKGRGDMDGSVERSAHSISRRISRGDHASSNHQSGGNSIRFPSSYQDRFDFSLRIGSLEVDMSDGDLKTYLFEHFKHYGFLQIKVLGRGYERHAFINFNRKEDAQRALSEMSEFVIDGVTLKAEWSKSTLYRYPEVIHSPFQNRSRNRGGEGLSSRTSTSDRSGRRHHHHEDHYDNYSGGSGSGGRDGLPPPLNSSSSSREKSSYSGGGREVVSSSSSRRSREVSSRDVSREISREVAHSRDLPPSTRDLSRHLSSRGDVVGRRDGDITTREHRNISYKMTDASVRSLSPSSPPPRGSGGGGGGGHHSSSSGGGLSSSSRHEARPVIPITDPMATRTLFVGNLEQDITERELRDLFGPYGRIESVDIKTARLSGATYAFVKFLTINDAINAKDDMHGRKYGEYYLKIGFGRGAPTGKVWIGNLTCLADLKEVRQELDRFGLIRKLDYQEGDNHAFIQFDSMDAAQAAIASLAGYRIRNTGRILKIDLCKPMHLREDPDLHIRHHAAPERSHSLDSGGPFPASPSLFKRKVREQEYQQQLLLRRSSGGGGGGVSVHRIKDDIASLKGERVVSSGGGGGKGRGARDENRREVRKRQHSPPPPPSGSGGRSRSEGVNGVNDSHHHKSKRAKVEGDSGSGGRRSERDKGRDGDRERERNRDHDNNKSGRDRERDSKRSSGDKRDHQNGKRDEEKKRDEKNKSDKKSTSDEKSADKKEEKKVEQQQQQHPMLETTLSDSATAKDTALKLDGGPEQLAMETGAGGSVPPLPPVVPETLNDLAKLYPVAWRGNLVLKNTGFPTRMHLVGGDPAVAETLLRTREGKDYLISLRITQRLRLEKPRLEEVNKRMSSAGPSGFCVLLALPGGTTLSSTSAPQSPPDADPSMQLRPLKSLVSYLKQKEAAGIVALSGPEGSDTASASVDKDVVGVLHAFPPCEFSQSQLVKIAPKLGPEPAKEDHIVVLLVKGNV